MSRTERLPMPDWTREGETWRVEPEPWVTAESDGVCTHHERYGPECLQPSVAAAGRSETLMLCQRHLHEQRMWIEDSRVVSWALRP